MKMKNNSLAHWAGAGTGGTSDVRPYVVALIVNRLGKNANGIDIGCSSNKLMPQSIGIDTHRGIGSAFEHNQVPDQNGLECVNLVGNGLNPESWFRAASIDYVFSSHMLEHVEKDAAKAAIGSWAKLLNNGGLLILYLPDSRVAKLDQYHKWHPDPTEVADWMDDALNTDIYLWTPREDLHPAHIVGTLAWSFLLWGVKP